jgi:CubicO group peptidase (beta-lactamase class C family)
VIDRTAVSELLERARRDVERGFTPSCQLALARDGLLVLHETFGTAVPQSRYVIFSVTKAVVASGIWLLVGEGRLAYETPVADLVPGFGDNGKSAVTVEHLLLHTAGFPRAPMRPEEGADPERRLERLRSWRLDWEPGTRTEYHPTSAHWVMAELIERSSGTGFRRFVNDRIAAPLGLDRLRLGVAPAEQPDVNDISVVGEASALGTIRRADGDLFTVPEIRIDILLRYNEPGVREAGVPGAGAVATAADVAMLFQAFLRNEAGIWDAGVLTDATHAVRNVFTDPYTRVAANRTRGLVAAGDDGFAMMRSFGDGVSPRAFASPGVGGQVAWADPESGLSFCYLTNGIDSDLVRAFRRSHSLSTLAAGCAPDR